jgi:hypothetical protein
MIDEPKPTMPLMVPAARPTARMTRYSRGVAPRARRLAGEVVLLC